MAPVITRASHPKALWEGINTWWGIKYNKHEPVWKKLFDVKTSTKSYEEDAETLGFGLMSVKDEGGGISYDTAQQGTVSRYTHVTYALGYQVTMEELQDNLYEEVSFKRSERLARSVYETEEILHALTFNRGFTSGFNGGDGVPLFSASHPNMNGNQSNLLTTAADLSEAAIEDMVIQIKASTDSRGLKFSNKPRLLMVPDALEFEANRIVKSVLQNDTANNAVNVIRANNTFPEGILVNTYLTDPDAWFIRTDAPEGTKHFTRMAATFDQDNDFDSKNLRASVLQRYAFGWTNWRGWWGTPGA
jgi:hypothetical protein